MTLLEAGHIAGRTTVRLARPPVSAVVRPRLVLTCLAMAIVAVVAFCAEIVVGDYSISLVEVAQASVGIGDEGALVIVQQLRLPRALVGLLVGVAFGVSGALLQTMTRNPLASPDIIGITAGASTAAVAGLTLGFGAGLGTPGLALVGGLLSALVVYLLAWKRGTTGYRIVLVGIGVSWMCVSATDYLLVSAQVWEVQQALAWLVGSLNGRDWAQVVPLALATAVLVPAAMLQGRWLRTLHLGDELAGGLGVPVHRARLALVVTAVALAACATAAAGPIGFVALAAPQIAQRMAGVSSPPPLASAITGATIVLASDLLARELFESIELPVGVVTGVLGAPFLLWLLTRTNRIGSGG